MEIAIAIIVILLVAARDRARHGAPPRDRRRLEPRDPKARPGAPTRSSAAATSTSTDLELQGRERADETRARGRRRGRGTQPGRAVTQWEPVDEEELGVTRRQFLNRGVLAAVGFARRRRSAPACSRSCGRRSSGGFGGKVAAGKLERHPRARSPTQKRRSTCRSPAPTSSRTRRPTCRRRRAIYPPAVVRRAWSRASSALYQKCVHLGCRVPWCDDRAVVRVPVPRFEVQPGRREARRPGASRSRPLPRDRSTAAASRSTPARCSPARRSVPTPPARRPKDRTASDAAAPDVVRSTSDRRRARSRERSHLALHPQRRSC